MSLQIHFIEATFWTCAYVCISMCLCMYGCGCTCVYAYVKPEEPCFKGQCLSLKLGLPDWLDRETAFGSSFLRLSALGLQLLKLYLFNFMNRNVFRYICAPWVCLVSQSPEELINTGITHMPCRCWEPNSGLCTPNCCVISPALQHPYPDSHTGAGDLNSCSRD